LDNDGEGAVLSSSGRDEILRIVYCVILCDKVRSCEIHKTLKVEPLLRMERPHLGWFGRVTRMPQ